MFLIVRLVWALVTTSLHSLSNPFAVKIYSHEKAKPFGSDTSFGINHLEGEKVFLGVSEKGVLCSWQILVERPNMTAMFLRLILPMS
jgi:hypothetical protein